MNTNLIGSLPPDIRGIKPPVEIPYEFLWLWIALAVVALVAGAIIVWLRLRKSRAGSPVPPPVPPQVRAKQRLAEALRFISEPNRFCTEVSGTLRVYLEERFSLRAPERTTEEFLVELQNSSHLTLDQKLSLGEFLQSCDLVKFARHEPTEETLRRLHEAALRLIDETQFDPIGVAPAAAAAIPASATGSPPRLPGRDSSIVNRKS